MQASAWLAGLLIGQHSATRGRGTDDPNDVVPHEDRRELRGVRLLAAWLDRFDARAGNTLDTWVADPPGDRDVVARPRRPLPPRHERVPRIGVGAGTRSRVASGYSYVVDWGDLAGDFVSLGARQRPWETAQATPKGADSSATSTCEDFVPDDWKNEYPERRLQPHDRARRRVDGAHPRALHAGDGRTLWPGWRSFTDPGNTAYLERVLEGRLERILERYLTRLSPIADVRLEGTDRLCGVDLAEWRGLRPADRFRYVARRVNGPWLQVERRAGSEVCGILSHVAAEGGAADNAPERYLRVQIQDGVAKGSLIADLYDLGPARGFRLVGLERPEP